MEKKKNIDIGYIALVILLIVLIITTTNSITMPKGVTLSDTISAADSTEWKVIFQMEK